MGMAFTNKFIRSLGPKAAPYRKWERGSDRGFGIQITPRGVKTFFLGYRFEGERRFYNLGRYSETPLAKARERCREARRLLDQGIDPKAHEDAKREAARAERRAQALQGSVQALFKAYVAHLKKHGRPSASEVERTYYHDVAPMWGDEVKAREIVEADVKRVLHQLIKRGAWVQANRVRAYLSAAFSFGIKHDNHPANFEGEVLFGLERNPVRDVPRPLQLERVGERDLSAGEIRDLWHGLETSKISRFMIIAIRLILATGGQRVKEVLWAHWAEFDTEPALWELPSRRTKNGRAHVVPLASLALELLGELAVYSGDRDHLFPRRGMDDSAPVPVASISRTMQRFCVATYENEQKQECFRPFTPRDLRRTVKTRMAELGVPKEIRDRLHNHALNDVASKHYDRYDYLPQKWEAMRAWDTYLQSVIAGNKVVPMRKPETA
jgi:integrase